MLLIARLTPINVYAHQQLLSGTHKNLQRLVFAQSIQLSNIVLISLLVYSETDYPAGAGMGLTNSRVCKPRNSSNPMFGANHVDAQHQADQIKLQIQNPLPNRKSRDTRPIFRTASCFLLTSATRAKSSQIPKSRAAGSPLSAAIQAIVKTLPLQLRGEASGSMPRSILARRSLWR